MNYDKFPSERPDEKYIIARSAQVIKEVIRPHKSETAKMLDISFVDGFGQPTSTVITIPRTYSFFIGSLLYRRFALATLLHHDASLKIKPYPVWVALAQNFLYVDIIWSDLVKEVKGTQHMHVDWRSSNFDKYIVTELVVRRHEPVYVSAYRGRCNKDMPNVNHAKPDDANVGLSRYTEDLGRYEVWGGLRFGRVVPNCKVSNEEVKQMLMEAREWYDDRDRPRILDPYTAEWTALGMEPRDPFDPNVEDNMEEDDNVDRDIEETMDEEVPKPPPSPPMLRLELDQKPDSCVVPKRDETVT